MEILTKIFLFIPAIVILALVFLGCRTIADIERMQKKLQDIAEEIEIAQLMEIAKMREGEKHRETKTEQHQTEI